MGRGADGVAVGAGGVWVASSLDRTVSRIDPGTSEVVATIPVGATPGEIAVGPDGVWVTARMQPAGQPADETIAIGVLSDCAGPYGGLYDLTLAGAELPLLQRGGRRVSPSLTDGVEGVSIGGRPVSLVFGCADGMATSALVETRRLVEDVGTDILIGPLAGSEELALQEYTRRQPGIAFVNGTSSAQLLDPAPNFFSFHIDGALWMAGVGDYAYHDLGWRTAVIVAGTTADIFAWSQAAGFVAEFCSVGGTIAKRIWVPRGTQDYSSVIAKIPPTGVDGFVVAAGPETVLALARGYAGLRGNLSRKMVLGTVATLPELAPLEQRITGVVFSVGGAVPLPTSRKYLTDFREAFPQLGAYKASGLFDVFYYDAMAATLKALDRVGGDLSGGEKRFMAVLSTLELDAPNGHTTLDADRQAIAPNYLQQLLGPSLDARVIRMIPRVERTFGGLFSRGDSPPSKTTPPCRKGNPPPWARR